MAICEACGRERDLHTPLADVFTRIYMIFVPPLNQRAHQTGFSSPWRQVADPSCDGQLFFFLLKEQVAISHRYTALHESKVMIETMSSSKSSLNPD